MKVKGETTVLMNLILEAMQKQYETTAPMLVVADFLEMECKDTQDRQHYVNLLRRGKLTPNDFIAIVEKFGTGRERKQAGRIRRESIKWFVCEHHSQGKRKRKVKSWLKRKGHADQRMQQTVLTRLEIKIG